MKHLILFLFSIQFINAQKISGIIFDKDLKIPISDAYIYNNQDFTLSNEVGKFILMNSNDSIFIHHIDYEPLKGKINQIEKNDTIFLKNNSILEIVTINKNINYYFETLKNIEKNYPIFPYTENIFLRIQMKIDGEIVQLQDISGKLHRNSLFSSKEKNIKDLEYKLQIINQRKVIKKKYKSPDIEFYNTAKLFKNYSSIFFNKKEQDISKNNNYNESNYVKLDVFFKNSSLKNIFFGYYLIDKKKYTIPYVEHDLTSKNIENIPYKKIILGKIKYRTIQNKNRIFMIYNDKLKKYHISNAVIDQKIEVLYNKEKYIYDISYQLISNITNPNEEIKSNFNQNKDLFEADFPYSADFWAKQNQLLLTDEMKKFINSLEETDKKQYKILMFEK